MLYFFENFAFDPARRELRRGDALIAVQPQVFDLLEYLIRNRDRVVSKNDILNAVWGGRIVSDSALTTRINAARTAIGDDGDQQRLIRTVPRKGTRFVGAVQEQLRPIDASAMPHMVLQSESSGRRATSSDDAVPAERRQLTIASCELLVSATASTRDPEDFSKIVRGYHNCVAETARRHKAFVAHTYGNTAVVYFGYPSADEDDTERAVRAALQLIALVSASSERTPVQTRVGIATGLVVVGDLIGAGEAQECRIVGETPNLAARLQGIAEPNTVVIAESTRRLLGNLFDFQDLGAQDLKGMGAPLRAWAALRPAPVESRFEALHTGGLTELVAGGEELELLLRRWSKAKAGEGQVVLLSGEAGIGKSRLTAGLLEHVAAEPHTRLRYFCSPQHTDSALHPVISQMERAAAFTHGDTAQAKLDKLDAVLAQTSTSPEDGALFAEMLALSNDGRYPKLNLTPEQRRQRTLEALLSQVDVLARQRPVVMIFEDAHWTDPTSLEVFSRTIDRTRGLRVLLVVTFRPEFDPPWLGRSYVMALTLNRLAERDIAAMIDRVVGNRSLPAKIRQDIIERTDGIPLFIEEMTKAVLEAGNEGAAQRIAAAFPLPALAVPASLQASLLSRLDRLGLVKEVAQIGAVIGREFSHALLSAVASKPEQELASSLGRLVHAGLLFRQGVAPHATYLFKHALVQDAAYGTLLREPRRALHARIADTLESQFSDIAANRPELLARHCTEAGLIERAASLWGKAGQRSLERSALSEAAEQLRYALSQFATLPTTPASRREQIKLQVALANALMHTKGYAATETKASFDQARLLIEQAEAVGEPAEDPLLLYSILYGFFIRNFIAFDGNAASALARQFLALAEQQNATVPVMLGHRLLGNTLLCIGEVTEGLAHLDRAKALYDPAAHRPLATRFGQDIGVATQAWRPVLLWLLGYPTAALVEVERALKSARDADHAGTLMFALQPTTFVQIWCGNYEAANTQIADQVSLADQKGAVVWQMLGTVSHGAVLALAGKTPEAVQSISAGIAGYRSTAASVWMTWGKSMLAFANADLGNFDAAWRCIDEAMGTIATTNERWFEAEVNRIAGEIALKPSEQNMAHAQAYFERALAVARQQQAKSWELRAAMSLARLWRDQGKRKEARELLAPVYGWFTEGFETLDLKEAKALLDELAI